MPAMHASVLSSMSDRLDVLLSRMVGLIPFDLTHEECIRLVAPSEHIAILTDAAKYADVRTYEQWMDLFVPAEIDGALDLKVHLYMRTHQQKEPPLRPRAPYWQMPTEPGAMAAGEKVITWATKRLELGRRFGLARWVLYQLSSICDNGTEVRYLWPVVMHLCNGAAPESRIGVWAERHQAYKPVRYAPTVSPQLKKAIRDSSTLLTSCALIGEDVIVLEQGEVQIQIWNLPNFKFEGETILRR